MLRTTTSFIGMAGSPYYNQLYFLGTTDGEADAAANAAYQFWGAACNGVSDLLSGQVENEVELVDPATGQVTDTFNTTTPALGGFATGDPLPPANQGLIRLLTSVFVNGRRLRGRVFIPGPTETFSSSTGPNSTYQGYMADAIEALIADGAPAGGAAIYSPTHRVFGEVTSGTLWTSGYAVLRSRRD